LAGDDPDVPLNIQAAIEQVYQAGSYRDRIDYTRPCLPPLTETDHAWAHEKIAAAESSR
jgi:hypothetical protein